MFLIVALINDQNQISFTTPILLTQSMVKISVPLYGGTVPVSLPSSYKRRGRADSDPNDPDPPIIQ
jgi:hypothetical protein